MEFQRFHGSDDRADVLRVYCAVVRIGAVKHFSCNITSTSSSQRNTIASKL